MAASGNGPTGHSIRTPQPSSANYHAQALARGLTLLEIIAEHGSPQTLQSLSDEARLAKSTLVRLLAVLSEMAYVVRVDDRPAYRLGYKVHRLSSAYVGSLDLSALVDKYLQPLASATGQTANLGVLEAGEVLHVCVNGPDRPLRFTMSIGERDFAHCTGLGKVLLSSLGTDQLDQVLPKEPYPSFTRHTLTSRSVLNGQLEAVRKRGYAVDDNERADGLGCVAVPVELTGRCLAAISLSGPSGEFTIDAQRDYVSRLQEVARQLVLDGDVVAALWSLRS